MSEYLGSNVSIDDLEALRALAVETIGENYLQRDISDSNGRFTIYDNVPTDLELARDTTEKERFFTFMSSEEAGQNSMSLYYKEFGLDKPMSMPARLEGFRFKWSENRVLFARMLVVLIKDPVYTRIPGDAELIPVMPARRSVEERLVCQGDMNHLWGRLCDMAAASYNKQAA